MPKNHLYWILATFLVFVFSAWCADPYAGTFRYIMRTVHRQAITPLSERKLFDAGVEGLLSAVDEYSRYIPPESYDNLNKEFIQKSGSIGILFYQTASPNKTWVGATEPRSAARLGGVLPGDEILEINGESLKDASFELVFQKLQVPEGTEVSLKLFRPSTTKEFTVLLVSQPLEISSVTGAVRLDDGSWSYRLPQSPEFPGLEKKKIFYVHIKYFGEETVREMKRILKLGKAEGAEGLVLDLTGNSGGLYEQGVDACGLFLPSNKYPCVYVTGRQKDPTDPEEKKSTQPEKKEVFSKEKRIWEKPVVVLIDRDTASAAEILATCLQDYGERGVVQAICVGERTFGKGTIQNLIDLGPIPDDRSLAKEKDPQTLWKKIWQKPVRGGISISTTKYLSPNGRNIHRFNNSEETDEWGISPNPGWEVSWDDCPRRNANKQKFATDRREFERLRKSGALPQDRWKEIYDFNPTLKRAAEVFNDVQKNFSPKTSDP